MRWLSTRGAARAGWIGVMLALALGAGGCGDPTGTSGYMDLETVARTPSAVIDAGTVMAWADEGRINAPLGRADRVVVVSVTTRTAFVTRRHIPDAVVLDYPTELTMVREEGLGPAGTMMLAGPQMDALVQRLGIDGHTTIVLTIPKGSSDSEQYQLAVAYWTFRYWGFPRERLKILNGGDDAWDAAGQPLTDAVVAVTPSTYSVSGNRELKDMVRYSVGEMLALVDAVNRDRSQLATWQMLDVRGFTTSPYLANTLRGGGGMQFLQDRVNGESGRNRLYPDNATLEARMASLPVMDGAVSTFLSPLRRTVVMCGTSTSAAPSFVLFDAVLGVPEGSIGMYDGSSTQWTNYSVARIRAAGATAAQANAWAFDVVSPGGSLTRAMGPLPAPVPGENPFVPGNFMYAPGQAEVNQIESADRAYMSRTTPGGGTPGGGGGTPGSGC